MTHPVGIQQVRREAKAFRVWREGTSVNWDCSLQDLSEATGVSYTVVRSLAAERGWPVVHDHFQPSEHIRACDREMGRSFR